MPKFRLVLVTAAFLLAAAPIGGSELTAQQILARMARAEGITAASSSQIVERAVLTENGLSEEITTISAPPNRILIRATFPWLGLTMFRGFDGTNAWMGAWGAYGKASPSIDRLVRSEASYANDADLFPDRWPMKIERDADATFDGKSYYQIRERPEGGNERVLYIDKTTFELTRASFAPERYNVCTERKTLSGLRLCVAQTSYLDGKAVGTFKIATIDLGKIVPMQFEMPRTPADKTTPWLLGRYASAVREPSKPQARQFKGEVTLGRYTGEKFGSDRWRLDLSPPMSYRNTFADADGDDPFWISQFDGSGGTLEYHGVSTPADYDNGLLARVLNRCELHAQSCGVTADRIGDVTLDAHQYYALRAADLKDPASWYVVLLDKESFLPAAAWTPGTILKFSGYRHGDNGPVPANWRFQRLWNEFIVSGVTATAAARNDR